MPRMLQRSAALAVGLIGLVLAFEPAQAATSQGYGSGCVGGAVTASYGRLPCRPVRTARRHPRSYRPLVAEARLPLIDPRLYGVDRYVSLLILGVGF